MKERGRFSLVGSWDAEKAEERTLDSIQTW